MKHILSKPLVTAVAKTDQNGNWLPFWMHALDTAGIIELLLNSWLPESTISFLEDKCGGYERLRSVSRFCALNHDDGKLTAIFAARITTAIHDALFLQYVDLPAPDAFRNASQTTHALAGEVILCAYGCPCGIASIVGAHHGKPAENSMDVEDQLDKYDGYPANYFSVKEHKDERFWRSMWEEWIDFSLAECGLSAMSDLPQLSQTAQVILCGLLIVADWLASNTTYFPLLQIEENGRMDMYPARVEAAWKELNFTKPWHSGAYFGMDEQFFTTRFAFAPNPLQVEVLSVASATSDPGIFIVEAPMGVGKTEAALAMAEIFAAKWESGGIFFGMPTQATSNGIFPRLEDWAKKLADDGRTLHSIRLAHAAANLNEDYCSLAAGRAAVNEEDAGLVVHSWLAGRKQALLADFVIGTVDQMLLAALKQKHVMLRHLGLIGKVVIVDEVHAYDTYMSRYLDRVLTWLGAYHVPVIILSATLPSARRMEMIQAYLDHETPELPWKKSLAYPQLTYTEHDSVEQVKLPMETFSKTVRIQKITENDLPGVVHCVVEKGGCVGVIVNTVQKAQRFAGLLRAFYPASCVVDMHAQFLMPTRASKEQQLLKWIGKHSTPDTRHALIVVGTQVLEQSLDIDFDLLITELCPMDLLIQRIGRLQRHKRIRPDGLTEAVCYVLDTEDETLDGGSSAIYGEWLLLRTRALLSENIMIPDDISILVQKTYDFDDMSMFDAVTAQVQKAMDDHKRQVEKLEQNAGNYLLPKPAEETDENTLDEWLNEAVQIRDVYAEKAVRYGDPSIDVIALWKDAEGNVHIIEEPGMILPLDRAPSYMEERLIARQKLRLPGYFGKRWIVDEVVKELEMRTQCVFLAWQESALLKEELVLLFDAHMMTTLCGIPLRYDREDGLIYERE